MTTPEPTASANGSPVVVNVTNTNTAHAGAYLRGHGRYYPQKVWVHTLLLFTTAGIGNVLYYLRIRSLNTRNGYR